MNSRRALTHEKERLGITLEALLLPAHQDRLEFFGDQLEIEVRRGSSAEVMQMWQRFSRELEGHLKAEEDLLLPLFCASHPVEGQKLLDEHAELRKHCEQTERAIAVGRTRLPELLVLMQALRSHGIHEDLALYSWAARHLSEEALLQLRARLKLLMSIGQ